MSSKSNKYPILIFFLFILGCGNSLENIVDTFEDQYGNEGVLCQDGKIFDRVNGEFNFHHRIANQRDFITLKNYTKGIRMVHYVKMVMFRSPLRLE